jgi:putative membrane protein
LIVTMTDLILAIVHHLIVFGIAAVLAAQLALLRPAAMSPQTVRLLGRFDACYGMLAMAILVVGSGRVFHGAKGAAFYLHNPVFWVKVGAFAVVGLLSVKPTMRILAWKKSLQADAAFTPAPEDLQAIRRRKLAEIHVFTLIPIAAAVMARGIGH